MINTEFKTKSQFEVSYQGIFFNLETLKINKLKIT